MIGIYEDVARNFAGIPVIAGRKSRLESFAGANVTYTIEGMMGDRRALQVLLKPGSHHSRVYVSGLRVSSGCYALFRANALVEQASKLHGQACTT